MPPPPSREPGQAGVPDAEAEEWHAHLTMPRTDGKQDDREEFILALLRDRTRYRERITELQMRIEVRSRERHEQHRVSVTLPVWDKCPVDLCMADRALLGEVPDGE